MGVSLTSRPRLRVPNPARRPSLREALPIPGCIALWDCDEPHSLWTDTGRTAGASASGDPIGAITDLTGNGNHWTASTRPTLTLNGWNGRRGVTFNGSSQWMNANGLAALVTGSDQPYTVMLAVKMNALSGTQTVFSYGRSSTLITFSASDVLANGNLRLNRKDDASATVAPASPNAGLVDTARAHLLTWHFTGTTVNIFLDTTTVLANGAADVGASTLNICSLGAWERNAARTQFASMTFYGGLVLTIPPTPALRERVYRALVRREGAV